MLVEEEIVLELQSKDKQKIELAFNKLYNKYYRLVLFIVGKYVKNTEDKEDLVQSVFFKIYQTKNKIRDYKTLSSYISTISKNMAINYSKKNERNVCLENEDNIVGDSNVIYIPEFSKYLKKDEADIVVLKIYYGYKFQEIGELLKMPQETVASKYYRSLEVLKKYYGG